ncbi:hypothetical protein [Anaeromassilibacillus sp. An200]|uniref:Uncharacterized protein n=1 Tax=Candidatus Caccousia stercoris TaxID=2840723 RepID=A0A9D1K1G6_9FIRM|nr:hypothetical protein [Anaeromassilibacillus sp. An200]OUP11614.1 hypothetical protein B5F35_10130 [Anaeromassilibacillus sp. An200]HIS77797.1 hypothetical protein [Candidatus Caccousia stercoris]
MEQATPNKLLKIGSILFIVGGLIGGLVPIIQTLSTMGTADDITSMYGSPDMFDQMILQESDGMITGDQLLGIFFGMVIGIAVLYGIMMLIHVFVGIFGLSRASRPDRVGFFTAWGVVLLVFGILNVLLSGVVSLNALAGVISGVAAPILFLVGASQVKKAGNQ